MFGGKIILSEPPPWNSCSFVQWDASRTAAQQHRPTILRGQFVQEGRFEAGGEGDFGSAGFGEDIEFVKASVPVFAQDEADGFDDLVLERPRIALGGFECQGVAAFVGALLKGEGLQRQVLDDDAGGAAGLGPADGDGALIVGLEALAEGVPGFLWYLHCHHYGFNTGRGECKWIQSNDEF